MYHVNLFLCVKCSFIHYIGLFLVLFICTWSPSFPSFFLYFLCTYIRSLRIALYIEKLLLILLITFFCQLDTFIIPLFQFNSWTHCAVLSLSSSLSLTLSDSVCMKDSQTQDNSLYFELSNQDAFLSTLCGFWHIWDNQRLFLLEKRPWQNPSFDGEEKNVYTKKHICFPGHQVEIVINQIS